MSRSRGGYARGRSPFAKHRPAAQHWHVEKEEHPKFREDEPQLITTGGSHAGEWRHASRCGGSRGTGTARAADRRWKNPVPWALNPTAKLVLPNYIVRLRPQQATSELPRGIPTLPAQISNPRIPKLTHETQPNTPKPPELRPSTPRFV